MLRRARTLFAPVWRAETYRRLVHALTGAGLGLCYLLAPLALVMGSAWISVFGVPLLVVVSGFSRTLRDLDPSSPVRPSRPT